MKHWGIIIVQSILIVVLLIASPIFAKDQEIPQKGILWETIADLQEQIDGIDIRLDEFTEQDPVFSEMDTEEELEAQVGDNLLTVGEDISLLNNDVGYLTEGLQVGDIVTVYKYFYWRLKPLEEVSGSLDLDDWLKGQGLLPISISDVSWVPAGPKDWVDIYIERDQFVVSDYYFKNTDWFSSYSRNLHILITCIKID